MRMCVFVYVRAYLCACKHACTHVRIHPCVHVLVCVYACVFVFVCIHPCARVCSGAEDYYRHDTKGAYDFNDDHVDLATGAWQLRCRLRARVR